MDIEIEEIKKNLNERGYVVFYQKEKNFNKYKEEALNICKNKKDKTLSIDKDYPSGMAITQKISNFKNKKLLELVVNDKLRNLFLDYKCIPQDIYITHENKCSQKELGNTHYLHFDKRRCFKVLVYLEDVCDQSGPFTIVKNSAPLGTFLRLSFKSCNNERLKKNKILHYPDITYELFPIVGKPGTTIIFDSDLFHLGGQITGQGKTRTVIRSHWYENNNWRINSKRKIL